MGRVNGGDGLSDIQVDPTHRQVDKTNTSDVGRSQGERFHVKAVQLIT